MKNFIVLYFKLEEIHADVCEIMSFDRFETLRQETVLDEI